VAIQGADGDAGVARDLLQGCIHTVCGELALRRGDELVAAPLGVAAQGPPLLLNVALAHFISLSTMLRAASGSGAAQGFSNAQRASLNISQSNMRLPSGIE
jgi:hypothetical protein